MSQFDVLRGELARRSQGGGVVTPSDFYAAVRLSGLSSESPQVSKVLLNSTFTKDHKVDVSAFLEKRPLASGSVKDRPSAPPATPSSAEQGHQHQHQVATSILPQEPPSSSLKRPNSAAKPYYQPNVHEPIFTPLPAKPDKRLSNKVSSLQVIEEAKPLERLHRKLLGGQITKGQFLRGVSDLGISRTDAFDSAVAGFTERGGSLTWGDVVSTLTNGGKTNDGQDIAELTVSRVSQRAAEAMKHQSDPITWREDTLAQVHSPVKKVRPQSAPRDTRKPMSQGYIHPNDIIKEMEGGGAGAPGAGAKTPQVAALIDSYKTGRITGAEFFRALDTDRGLTRGVERSQGVAATFAGDRAWAAGNHTRPPAGTPSTSSAATAGRERRSSVSSSTMGEILQQQQQQQQPPQASRRSSISSVGELLQHKPLPYRIMTPKTKPGLPPRPAAAAQEAPEPAVNLSHALEVASHHEPVSRPSASTAIPTTPRHHDHQTQNQPKTPAAPAATPSSRSAPQPSSVPPGTPAGISSARLAAGRVAVPSLTPAQAAPVTYRPDNNALGQSDIFRRPETRLPPGRTHGDIIAWTGARETRRESQGGRDNGNLIAWAAPSPADSGPVTTHKRIGNYTNRESANNPFGHSWASTD